MSTRKVIDDGDDSSASYGESSSGASSNVMSSSDGERKSGKRENRAVSRLRIAVTLIMLLVSVAVSFAVYSITSNAESEEFESQYESMAEKVMASFEDIIHRMGAVSAVGVAMTAHSQEHGVDGWPFFTLSSFQQRAGNARELSDAHFVSIAPIVTTYNFLAWNEYVNGIDSSWIDEGYAFQEEQGLNDFEPVHIYDKSRLTGQKVDPMHYWDYDGTPIQEPIPVHDSGVYLPVWQTSPVMKRSIVNENMVRRTNTSIPQKEVAAIVLGKEEAMIGGFFSAPSGGVDNGHPTTSFLAALESHWEGRKVEYLGDPMAYFYFPVFDRFDIKARKVVAIMTGLVHWRTYFRDILPKNSRGIIVVLENSCDGYFTYELDGDKALVVGFGDQHESEFDSWERKATFKAMTLEDGTAHGMKLHQEGCQYHIHVYPSHRFYNLFNTSTPLIITFSILGVLVFSTFVFLFYDRLLHKRQAHVLKKAKQSSAIVSSLFPKNVTDKLLEADSMCVGSKSRLKGFLTDGRDSKTSAAPIADLFPQCTVMFADISGFSAWSSTREPAQVFILLESIYRCFDFLAKRRQVFKVETIGDSYMAATGLPEPQQDHAVRMVRFAWDCLVKINHVTKELECSLGPDTGDLSIRVGLHSGPVTAGVLRGERARFQVFGDAVNTAARMESTGIQRKIQISTTTAQLLRDAGKEHWLKQREDMVQAIGNKGSNHTFWVNPTAKKRRGSTSSRESDQAMLISDKEVEMLKTADQRLINWVTDMLVDGLKKIVHFRNLCDKKECKHAKEVTYHSPEGMTCLDEVKTEIKMPAFNNKTAQDQADYKNVKIDDTIVGQLRDYVAIIASLYRNNPFHNFEHACHVTMSVNKLLKRVVAPELTAEEVENFQKKGVDIAMHIHDYTHGINSDPLTIFAMTFSALIHDVDHRGVSNMQLDIEAPELGARYRNKSTAEQNSLDIAWEALMQDRFSGLRRCMFYSTEEMMRFREIVVNTVLATDIFDKELNDLRKRRWTKAFNGEDGASYDNDLRATIVLEHIIQASDVSHTMQHWHVYQKWNRKLFTELYAAYKAGRMGKDPSTFWYKGEIGFFDNYIIPLAKKLKDCGVFGVSSDEYLNYAERNRAEWAERGETIVSDLIQSVTAPFGELDRKPEKLESTEEKPEKEE